MANNNAFLAKQESIRQASFAAGGETMAQQTWDMICLVLNDPEVMGKDTFGAKRLKKLLEAVQQRERQYIKAWISDPESDYYEAKLDEALKSIFGEIVPFKERYPYLKGHSYDKPFKKGRR